MRSIFLAITLLVTSPAIAGITIAPYDFKADDGTVVKADRGKFDVPRHHAEPDGATFTLHFVRFPSTNPNPGSPIVYLRSEEHTSELQSLMRISSAVFCL